MDPKGHTWDVLTNKWMLSKNQKSRIPKIEFTELKKFNMLKGPSEDAFVPPGREKEKMSRWEGPSMESG